MEEFTEREEWVHDALNYEAPSLMDDCYECNYCHAYLMPHESKGTCCNNNQVAFIHSLIYSLINFFKDEFFHSEISSYIHFHIYSSLMFSAINFYIHNLFTNMLIFSLEIYIILIY